MSSNSSLARVIFILSAISVIGFNFYTLNSKNKNFLNRLEIAGLDRVSSEELMGIVGRLGFENKEFFKTNPQQIAKLLEKQPLIKSAKVRSVIFPKTKYRIIVTEEKPWAIYRRQVINNEGHIIINSRTDAKLFESSSIDQLYEDYTRKQSDLITIASYDLLEKKDFNFIKQITDHINLDLKLVSALETVVGVILDSENNLIIQSQNYEFKAGLFDKKIMDRVKKLDLIASKIKELEKNGSKIAYVDLSLGVDEVIVGKENNP